MSAQDSAIALEIVIDNLRIPVMQVAQLTQRILLDKNAQHHSDHGYRFGNDEDDYYGNYDLHKDVGDAVEEWIKRNARTRYKLDADGERDLVTSVFSALLSRVDWNALGEHYVQSARERYGYRWETTEQEGK